MQNLLNKCGRCYTTMCQDGAHCSTLLQECYFVKYIMYAPMPHPSILRFTCPWLLTAHLLLNLYHEWFRQDLNMGHGTPLAGIRYRGTLTPFHPHPNHKVTYQWLSTGHLLLDLHCVSLSQDLHMKCGPPLASRNHRKCM